jgi:hypothetical protein
MMAGASFDEVFALLIAAFAGLAAVQVALMVGGRRAVLRTRRMIPPRSTDTGMEASLSESTP